MFELRRDLGQPLFRANRRTSYDADIARGNESDNGIAR